MALSRPARRPGRQRQLHSVVDHNDNQQHERRQLFVVFIIIVGFVGDSFARLGQEPPLRLPFAVRISPASLLRHGRTPGNARTRWTRRPAQSQRQQQRTQNVTRQQFARQPNGRIRHERLSVARHIDVKRQRKQQWKQQRMRSQYVGRNSATSSATTAVAGRTLFVSDVHQS